MVTTSNKTKVFGTMFIGLGGTGYEVVSHVKQIMRRHHYDLPIYQYLVLDTMPYIEDANADQDRLLKNGTEYLYIGNYNPNDIVSNIANWPAIAKWWAGRDATNIGTVDEGAGQMRAVGRMSFFRHFKEIYAQLEAMVGEVMSSTNRNALLSQNYEVPADRSPVIYIVSSLCGGTGSSLFFDVAYILRKLFAAKNTQPTIVALAVLPGPFIRRIQSNPQKERIQANTYAALQELEALHNMALGQGQRLKKGAIWDVEYPNNVRVTSYDLPFDYIYLLDDTAKNGLQYTLEQVCELAGHALFWLSGPSTAIKFWGRAKNLVSNNLASGGSMDITGGKRLSKYSALGISTAALDWNASNLLQAFEAIMLEAVRDIKPGQLQLPQWLENAEQMILTLCQPLAPTQIKQGRLFKSAIDVEIMLNAARTEYATRTKLASNSRWVARRKAFQENALKEITLAIQEGLRKRGPMAVYQEVDRISTTLQEMKNYLQTQEGKAIEDAQSREQKFHDMLQIVAPQSSLRELANIILRAIRVISGRWSANAEQKRWKRVADNALSQLHLSAEAHFRSQACHELREHIVEPAIDFVKQWRSSLEEAREILLRWLQTTKEDLKKEEQQRRVRAQALFEPVIWITPAQSDTQQVQQAIDRHYGNKATVTGEVLEETFASPLLDPTSIAHDLRNTIVTHYKKRISLFTGHERALERLARPDSTVQRDQFWLRAECLLSYRQNATQGAEANLESIDVLGVGENTNDALIKTYLKALPVPPKANLEQTTFGNELVYVRTLHGLPITLLHGIEELHEAYIHMSAIRDATYLHLDYRDEVVAGYLPLTHTNLTYKDFIEEWEGVINDITRINKTLADYVQTPLNTYKSWLISEGKLNHHIQVVPQSTGDLDPILQFFNIIEHGLKQFPKKPAETIPVYLALANLQGIFKTQGWVKAAGNWRQYT